MHTFEGKVVSMTGNKLLMTNQSGKEHTHTFAPRAKFTRDGMACAAEDIVVGTKIRVTTKTDDRSVAICVDALEKETKFAT
jgi:hypothetical protein